MMKLMAWITMLTLVTAACSAAAGPGSSDDPGVSTPSGDAPTPSTSGAAASGLRQVTPVPGSPGTGSGALSQAIVDPVIADAAARAGVPITEVTVISAEPKTWPDGGLGCPLPGMAYPQVMVDGYQIVVQVGQQTFDYRGSAPGKFRLCTTQG
jgi:hypothetical protein